MVRMSEGRTLFFFLFILFNYSAGNESPQNKDFKLQTVIRIVSGKAEVLHGTVQQSNMDIEFCRNALLTMGIDAELKDLRVETYSFQTNIRSNNDSTHLECTFYKTDIDMDNPKLVRLKNDISKKGFVSSLIKQYKAPVYSYFIDCKNRLCFISHIGLPLSYMDYDFDGVIEEVLQIIRDGLFYSSYE